MVAPLVWALIALLAVPAGTDWLVGKQIDSNSPQVLIALKELGERETFRTKEYRIAERTRELKAAKTSKAVLRGKKNLDKELGGNPSKARLAQRQITLTQLKKKFIRKNNTRALAAITKAFTRPLRAKSRTGIPPGQPIKNQTTTRGY